MFFLIVPGIVSFVSGDEDEAGKPRVDEFSMAAFASLDALKSRLFQIGDELTNLPRHMEECVTGVGKLRAFRPRRGVYGTSWRQSSSLASRR